MQLTRVGVLALMLTLAVDLHPTPEKQYVEVRLGYSEELKKTVEVNLTRETEVEFTLQKPRPKRHVTRRLQQRLTKWKSNPRAAS